MLYSLLSPTTSLHAVSITPLSASSYAPCGFFLSMRQIQCEYLLTFPVSESSAELIYLIIASSRTRSKMQQFGFVPMTKGTGHRFFIPQKLSILTTNLTRAYFGGLLLSEYVISLLFYKIHNQPV